MRKIALCLDQRTQKPIITLYKIAKKYDFLEIRRTGTYRELLQAHRKLCAVERTAPAQSDYKKL
jgi:hypothetical protein